MRHSDLGMERTDHGMERTLGDQPVRYLGISPYYYYEDAAAALDWLSRTVGFVEVVRYLDEEGVVKEAEMTAGDTVIQLSGYPGYWAEQGVSHPVGQENVLYVDDVDAHWARAKAAGVDPKPPGDKPYGVRAYSLTDPEGHVWSFWQRLTDTVALPEGWQEIRSGATA